ncbi:MAG: hypothetical protein JWO14_2971 [Solirubrobacterales bacterium]|nr:hypothetical protein [Solirubrobacterales bacterium]
MTEVVLHKGIVEQQATLEIGTSLISWLEEALCDALASSYLGPTYLFSFVAEVVAGNLDRAGASHPSPKQRIRLMLQILDSNGWAPTMSAQVPELTDWLRNVSAAGPTLERELGFLTWVLDTVARDLRRAVDSKFGNFRLTPDSEVLREIDALLKVGIPPAQTHHGDAIDPRAIAVGSWFHALSQAGGDIVSVPEAVDSAEIESLLPKGLEMAAQLAAWR